MGETLGSEKLGQSRCCALINQDALRNQNGRPGQRTTATRRAPRSLSSEVVLHRERIERRPVAHAIPKSPDAAPPFLPPAHFHTSRHASSGSGFPKQSEISAMGGDHCLPCRQQTIRKLKYFNNTISIFFPLFNAISPFSHITFSRF